MNSTPPSMNMNDDPQLMMIVQRYMMELESGARPNRAEFLQHHDEICRGAAAVS